MTAANIEVVCDCGKSYKVPRSQIGRKIQCRRCGEVLRVQAEEAAPAPFSMALVSMEDTGLAEDLPFDINNYIDADDTDDDGEDDEDAEDDEVDSDGDLRDDGMSAAFGGGRSKKASAKPVDDSVGDLAMLDDSELARPWGEPAGKAERRRSQQDSKRDSASERQEQRSSRSGKDSHRDRRESQSPAGSRTKRTSRPTNLAEKDGAELGAAVPFDLDAMTSKELLGPTGKSCPRCAAEMSVDARVCISCGYDFVKNDDVSGAIQRPPTRKREALRDAEGYIKNLERLGWVSLTPLGLILGPYTLIRSFQSEAYEDDLRRKAKGTFRSSLTQVRVVALIASILWIGGAAAGAVYFKNRRPQGDLVAARKTEDELQTLARLVRETLIKDSFPSALNLDASSAIESLSKALPPGLDGKLLARKYDARFEAPIDRQASASRWLFWERRSSIFEGRDVVTLVHLNGEIERIPQKSFLSALNEALPRKEIKTPTSKDPNKDPDKDPDKDPENPNDPGKPDEPGTGEPKPRKVVQPVDDPDSGFRGLIAKNAKVITIDELDVAVGMDSIVYLSRVLKGADIELIKLALLALDRIEEIVDIEKRRLTLLLSSNTVPARILMIQALRRQKEAAWINYAARIVHEVNEPEITRPLIEDLLNEAKSGEEGFRAVVRAGSELRVSDNETGLLLLPAELFPGLIPFLAEEKLVGEARALLYMNEEAAIPPLIEALNNSAEPLASSVLDTLVQFPFLQDQERVLEAISQFLLSSERSTATRVKTIEGLQRFDAPLSIRIAAQQYPLAPRELEKAVFVILESALNRADRIGELARTLDTKASGLTKAILAKRLNREIMTGLAKEADKVATREGREILLELSKTRNDPGAIKVLRRFSQTSDDSLRKRLLDNLQALPDDPISEDLIEVAERLCGAELKDPERNDDLKTKACKLLALYQNPKNIKALATYAEKGKSVPARVQAVIALESYNSIQALEALRDIEKDKSNPDLVRKRADASLRKVAGGRDKDENWNELLRARRSQIDKKLEEQEKARQDKMKELHLRAVEFSQRFK